MSAIARILERLPRRPELRYRRTGDTIVVEPPTPDGFAVSLTELPGEWVVVFDRWHEHFRSEERALDCFAFGLSDRCRLRLDYRGSAPYRWTVEERTADGWRAVDSVGRLLFPFWRPRKVEYRQNGLCLDDGSSV